MTATPLTRVLSPDSEAEHVIERYLKLMVCTFSSVVISLRVVPTITYLVNVSVYDSLCPHPLVESHTPIPTAEHVFHGNLNLFPDHGHSCSCSLGDKGCIFFVLTLLVPTCGVSRSSGQGEYQIRSWVLSARLSLVP